MDAEFGLMQLQEAFYYYKSEAMESFSDDELIEFMAEVFNGRAQGSTEYLIGTSLDALCRYAKSGFDPFESVYARKNLRVPWGQRLLFPTSCFYYFK